MKTFFEVILLEEAIEFIDSLDKKSKLKILYNMDRAKFTNDPKLFKKLEDDIWELRTVYGDYNIDF